MKPRMTLLGGWPLFGLIAGALTALCLALAASGNFETESTRLVIRVTARTSLVLFLTAYAASALFRLWPARATRWLLQNRRYIGVSFAASHLLHGIAIVAFSIQSPEEFANATNWASYAFGGTGYAFIALLALTSFDRTARAIGRRTWRILHTSGTFYIWVQFMISFGKRVPENPRYAWFLVPLLAVMAIRIAAYVLRRAPQPQPQEAS